MTESHIPTVLDPDLLVRYLAAEATPAEVATVERWAAASPANRRELTVLARVLAPEGGAAEPADEDELWQRLAARLGDRPRLALHRPGAIPARPRRALALPASGRRPWIGIAAAAVLAVIGGLALWRAELDSGVTSRPAVEAAAREYVTRRGERATLRLPDGTRVILGVASILRVPDDFGGGARNVRLEGEAHFDVVHDSTRPFRVLAGNAVAEDLGTRFGVRAYPDEDRVGVVVAEGLVELTDGERRAASDSVGALLAPGQLGVLRHDGEITVRTGVDLDRYLGWTEGRLVFRDTPLRDAAVQLARWYDVDLQLASDTLASLPLTASFDDEPVQDVLQLVAVSLGLQLTRDGRGYVFAAR